MLRVETESRSGSGGRVGRDALGNGCGSPQGADTVAAEVLTFRHVVLARDGGTRQQAAKEIELGDAGLREGVCDTADRAMELLEEIIPFRRPLPRCQVAVLVEVIFEHLQP